MMTQVRGLGRILLNAATALSLVALLAVLLLLPLSLTVRRPADAFEFELGRRHVRLYAERGSIRMSVDPTFQLEVQRYSEHGAAGHVILDKSHSFPTRPDSQ